MKAKGGNSNRAMPWTGTTKSEEMISYIGEIRDALASPDRDGNSLLSCLVGDTDYPYWEGEEKTIDKLALLGVIKAQEYNSKKFK